MFSLKQVRRVLSRVLRRNERSFNGSTEYWESRYAQGGHSGRGSYGALAVFKADFVNRIVSRYCATDVIEFGCGDGNQLLYATYPKYTGYDVSATAVSLCRDAFATDTSKEFYELSKYDGRRADIALSLDVLYHLVEDHVFERYMSYLFDAAKKAVVIYSSNVSQYGNPCASHVCHREFTKWIENNRPLWVLAEKCDNPFPYDPENNEGSFADFYVFHPDVLDEGVIGVE